MSQNRCIPSSRATLIGLFVSVATLGLLVGFAPLAGATSTTPFEIIAESPPGATSGVGGDAPIVVSFSRLLASATPHPVISPVVTGSWTVERNSDVFHPSVDYLPGSSIKVTIPTTIEAANGEHLASGGSFFFGVREGSVRRLDQLLATLDYLPVTFRATEGASLTGPSFWQSAFAAVPGRFIWRGTPPTLLKTLFQPGQDNLMLRGALIRFETANALPQTGMVDTEVWRVLARDVKRPTSYEAPGGYTYALASKTSPESLTIYDNGRIVEQVAANTGIPQSPTQDGNFLVYLKLPTQVMTGVDPWGTPYSDPVAFVSYFNGSDAVHYIARASYGYPQSLGCVELSYASAAQSYGYLPIGTIVSVTNAAP
jgi:lipoprotein-anchoring transpeptidase ErfK/SrfK